MILLSEVVTIDMGAFKVFGGLFLLVFGLLIGVVRYNHVSEKKAVTEREEAREKAARERASLREKLEDERDASREMLEKFREEARIDRASDLRDRVDKFMLMHDMFIEEVKEMQGNIKTILERLTDHDIEIGKLKK